MLTNTTCPATDFRLAGKSFRRPANRTPGTSNTQNNAISTRNFNGSAGSPGPGMAVDSCGSRAWANRRRIIRRVFTGLFAVSSPYHSLYRRGIYVVIIITTHVIDRTVRGVVDEQRRWHETKIRYATVGRSASATSAKNLGADAAEAKVFGRTGPEARRCLENDAYFGLEWKTDDINSIPSFVCKRLCLPDDLLWFSSVASFPKAFRIRSRGHFS